MQLVKTDGVHKRTGHSGSVSQFEKYFKTVYGKSKAIKLSDALGWLTGRKPRF